MRPSRAICARFCVGGDPTGRTEVGRYLQRRLIGCGLLIQRKFDSLWAIPQRQDTRPQQYTRTGRKRIIPAGPLQQFQQANITTEYLSRDIARLAPPPCVEQVRPLKLFTLVAVSKSGDTTAASMVLMKSFYSSRRVRALFTSRNRTERDQVVVDQKTLARLARWRSLGQQDGTPRSNLPPRRP